MFWGSKNTVKLFQSDLICPSEGTCIRTGEHVVQHNELSSLHLLGVEQMNGYDESELSSWETAEKATE